MSLKHRLEAQQTAKSKGPGHKRSVSHLGGKLITELSPAPAVRNQNRTARKIALPTFLVIAFAIALFALPASAGAFGVSGFSYTNASEPGASLSGLQAASHPTVTVGFTRTGTETEDLSAVQLDLPTGVFANPEAPTAKCTSAQFNSDTCPAGSNIGQVSTEVKAASLLPLTINGTIDILQPDPGQIATLGISLRPDKICIALIFCAVPQKIFLKTGVTVKTYEDSGLRTITGGAPGSAAVAIPLIVWTPELNLDITVNKMTLTFQSRAGDWTTRKECTTILFIKTCKDVPVAPTGKYFWHQTHSCNAATARLKLTSYQGATANATSSFVPSGCNSANYPFNPSITVAPADTTSNAPTTMRVDLSLPDADLPIQNSYAKIVDADFPAGSGLNLAALAGVDNCTEAELQAHNCPASSRIGSAEAFSKFMPGSPSTSPGLTGSIYAMSVTSQVDTAVQLDGPRGTVIVLRGTIGARENNAYALFDRIPQVPYKKFSLTLDRAVYKNPVACGPAETNAAITGFNGVSVARTSTYQVIDCLPDPETTITGRPLEQTTNTKPSFSFESDISSATFQCSVDYGPFAPCTSPFQTQALSLGNHNFRVKAVDDVREDQTPDSYDFEVVPTGYEILADIALSDTQAVAHPDLDASIEVVGAGQPKDAAIRLPRGFAASLSSVPLCDHNAGAVGNCPIDSKIGDVEVKILKPGNVTETKTGNMYLTDSPTADDAGGFAGSVDFDDGTLIATGGAFLVENGAYQYIELRDIPRDLNGNEFQAQKITLHLKGDKPEYPKPFLTNPSNCDGSSWDASSVSHDGLEAPAFSVPFQATGCETVPFGPALTQTIADPVAGHISGVTADLTMPTDNSAISTLQVDEPRVIKPNFPSFGEPDDQCPASSVSVDGLFDEASCPVQAKVGTMTLTTPLLTDPLEGEVYLIEQSPIPWLGVVFDAPGIHVTLVGVTSTPKVNPACNPITTPGGCPTRISIRFEGVPDVQISSLNMDLNGPDRQGVLNTLSGKILQLASPSDPGCKASNVASAKFASHSDPFTELTTSQTISVSGCLNP